MKPPHSNIPGLLDFVGVCPRPLVSMGTPSLKLTLCISTACHAVVILMACLGGNWVGASRPGPVQVLPVLTILSTGEEEPAAAAPAEAGAESTIEQKAVTRREIDAGPKAASVVDNTPLPPPLAAIERVGQSEPLQPVGALAMMNPVVHSICGTTQTENEGEQGVDEEQAGTSILAPAERGPGSGSAQYLRIEKPSYPREARRRNQEGLVVLSVKDSASGNPIEVSLKSSSGSSLLDVAAREAVRSWLFTPAMADGQEVESDVQVPIRFTLRD